MPVLDGYRTTIIIRNELKLKTPIIAMTAHYIEEAKKEAFKSGMNDFISKPIIYNDLIKIIKKYINIPNEEKRYNDIRNPEINIQGIDIKKTIGKFNEDYDLYFGLLKNFSMYYNPNYIKTLFFDKDISILKEKVHSLKGISGNLGMNVVFDLCKEIEKIIENKNYTNLEDLIDSLKNELDTINRNIDQIKLHKEINNNISNNLGNKDHKKIISKIISLLENNNFEILEYFEKNKNILKNIIDEDKFEILNKSINSFDFEKSLKILKNI